MELETSGVKMKVVWRIVLMMFAVIAVGTTASRAADELPLSQRAANAAMARWPNGRFVAAGEKWAWNYELGTLLEGMDAVWHESGNSRYFDYIRKSIDELVTADGEIPTWKLDEYQLDNILTGRQLLLLYKQTHEDRYMKAATLLYDQLQHQPRNTLGGFWHKQRYPNQMWLDGLYMAEPFYAEYAVVTHHPEKFNDIAHQFVLMEEHARDAKTGLLYHGWDASKEQRWANTTTGVSPEFWARGMGWFMMALVDTLDYFPEGDPGRAQLIGILQRETEAVTRYQDPATGLWYQVVNKAGEKGNYFESSAACMFVYALAKGAHKGYLPAQYLANAERGYQGILKRFVKTGADGDVSLTDTVKAAGLGGDPYRDGTYAYYIGEKTITNDTKGVGALLLASAEMESSGKGAAGAKEK
jgi:unsaturated rhamnogalacturonyl hydrolase